MSADHVIRGAHRQKFSQISHGARAFTLGVIATQALLHQSLRFVSSSTLQTTASRAAALYRRAPLPKPTPTWIAERSEMATELNPFPVECIAESIALWGMLRAGDHPAVLQLGVRNVLGHVEAHVWVELDDAVVNDPLGESTTWERFDRAWAGPDA